MTEQERLSLDDVRAIADLARLELTEAEMEKYQHQLSAILDYFTLLQEVDTSHIEPTASVLSVENVLREDAAAEPLDPEDAVKNAPDSEGNQFRVSAVLGDE